MSKPLSFQQVILRLQEFWAEHGCVIWQPYSEKVGAGTYNPATSLRVLGPEPWNVCYVEPSFRPDDGRYAENPNRMQMHMQLQVILKPDPGNPQELYLQSLEAIGIDRRLHDIRFVEDNWESPALGSWGLGWEVWCDGLEITQFTYFQQAGGLPLDPVAVELTYGLERIVMFLQDKRSVWDIDWGGGRTYGDMYKTPEVEYCVYDFEEADVERMTELYRHYEAEARACLSHEPPLVIPAHDYVLRCSHTFNLLDARGAIGVTERASYFAKMRDLSRQVAAAYVEQRQREEYPFLGQISNLKSQISNAHIGVIGEAASLLLEIGVEELPAGDLTAAIEQLQELAPKLLDDARLDHGALDVYGTPRRLVILAHDVAPRQRALEQVVRGPSAKIAFDATGAPTRAAEGFARGQKVAVADLQVRELDGGTYVVAIRREEGKPAPEVLVKLLPDLIAGLKFDKAMRWNSTNVAFSRPIRWLVALWGEHVIPFEYAGVTSGRVSRGVRADGSPDLEIPAADAYVGLLKSHGVILDMRERRAAIKAQIDQLAESVKGVVPDDPDLLDEVTNLVEQPTALLGNVEREYLSVPREVLVTVMRKHQRYFPVLQPPASGEPPIFNLQPHFIAVRNGPSDNLDIIAHGNEGVLRARFADAAYFVKHDTQKKLEEFLPRLGTLTFQTKLGSVLDKIRRIENLTPRIAAMLSLDETGLQVARRAARLCKADLATQMVVEITSLQGVIGREYALRQGEPPKVAQAILEHYLPRYAGDKLPESLPGIVVGLADKLDSLVGLFAVNLIPTGSADPFALRRAALGIVQVLIEKNLTLSVRELLREAAQFQPVLVSDETITQAHEFILGRLRVLLGDQGWRYDLIEAALSARGDDPHRARRAVEQLTTWAARPDWNDVLSNFARCVRITREFAQAFLLDISRDPDPGTQALYKAYQAVATGITSRSSVDEFFTAFMPMVPVISKFFVDVLVMAENPSVRETRLALLQRIAALPQGIVDLSKVEGF
jgi:glycyl-tRNA synthetase